MLRVTTTWATQAGWVPKRNATANVGHNVRPQVTHNVKLLLSAHPLSAAAQVPGPRRADNHLQVASSPTCCRYQSSVLRCSRKATVPRCSRLGQGLAFFHSVGGRAAPSFRRLPRGAPPPTWAGLSGPASPEGAIRSGSLAAARRTSGSMMPASGKSGCQRPACLGGRGMGRLQRRNNYGLPWCSAFPL